MDRNNLSIFCGILSPKRSLAVTLSLILGQEKNFRTQLLAVSCIESCKRGAPAVVHKYSMNILKGRLCSDWQIRERQSLA